MVNAFVSLFNIIFFFSRLDDANDTNWRPRTFSKLNHTHLITAFGSYTSVLESNIFHIQTRLIPFFDFSKINWNSKLSVSVNHFKELCFISEESEWVSEWERKKERKIEQTKEKSGDDVGLNV